jgi:protease I
MGEKASDLELISETVQHYFDGMYHRNIENLRRAFHAKAYLFGYFQGEFLHVSVEDWFKMVESRPTPAESGEEYDMRIVSTDLTGAVATVKVADLYQGLRFTDYLTLANVGGDWRIVNKAFHHDPKS